MKKLKQPQRLEREDEDYMDDDLKESLLEDVAELIFANLDQICSREKIEMNDDIKAEISFQSAIDIFDEECPGCENCCVDSDYNCPGCPECEAEMLDQEEDFDEELENICDDCRNKIDWDKN